MVYEIGVDLVAMVPQVFSDMFKGHDPLVVSDANTWSAGGRHVHDLLVHAGLPAQRLVFSDCGMVHADCSHVGQVQAELADPRLIAIAVGSGTINDIVKLASHLSGKQYMVVPTAPSVDGYTSVGSAMTIGAFKRTVYCSPPAAVLADTAMLCAAPQDMIASGYGDLAGKFTAGLDWIVADELGIEAIDSDAWNMVQVPLIDRLALAKDLSRREDQAIVSLFDGLVDSGFAMAAYKDSRPASGTEHLLSHVWEMAQLSCNGDEVLHGAKVAFGTLVASSLASMLVDLEERDVKLAMQAHPWRSWEHVQTHILGIRPKLPASCESLETARKKFLDKPAWDARRLLILERWGTIRHRLRDRMRNFVHLGEWLRIAGCPVEPAAIGLGRTLLCNSVFHAQLIRTRYTLLDLAYEIGMLEQFAESVSKDGQLFHEFAPD